MFLLTFWFAASSRSTLSANAPLNYHFLVEPIFRLRDLFHILLQTRSIVSAECILLNHNNCQCLLILGGSFLQKKRKSCHIEEMIWSTVYLAFAFSIIFDNDQSHRILIFSYAWITDFSCPFITTFRDSGVSNLANLFNYTANVSRCS